MPALGGRASFGRWLSLGGFFQHLYKFQDFVCLVWYGLFLPEFLVRAVPFAEVADVVQETALAVADVVAALVGAFFAVFVVVVDREVGLVIPAVKIGCLANFCGKLPKSNYF